MGQNNAALIGQNPFTPVFGKVPAHLAGREQLIGDILAAFEAPDNSPERCSIFVGARGSGKTALITYLAREAEARGWVSANVTATPGMLEEIYQLSIAASSHLANVSKPAHITSLSVAGIVGASWSREPEPSGNWRTRMNELLDQLASMGTGLLITVDEIDPKLNEMIQLVTTYQHFVREGRRVMLLMAGLPHRVSALLSGESTSFLRRAARKNLGSIPSYAVEDALRLTMGGSGKAIANNALSLAIDEIDGFPFMLQLVGYRSWNASGVNDIVTLEHVMQGARLARQELGDRVFDATLRELSTLDKAFLLAMAEDKGMTKQAELKARLGKSSSHISTYKKRLLEAGVIEEPRRGTLAFALPGFKDYLLSL